jgi:hypothetical protein
MAVSITMAKVISNIEAAGISTRTFAGLANIPVSSMTAAFRGDHYLGAETEAQLFDLSYRALEVVDSLRPLSIRGGDPAPLKALMNGRSAEEIRAAVNTIFEK